ncbi:MAG: ACT domain-containing protein [Candidatus Omnitrophica bacterium]|nr:ACT domain-containing protein [Candidatus Omnitrophota bacterium]
MVKKAVRGKEISVSVINEVGILAKITSFLVNHGINVEAVAGAARRVGEAAVLMFVTDDNLAAVNILNEHGLQSMENDIIIVELENTPGSLKNISEILAQNGINIEYIYGTTCSGGCPAKMILATSNDEIAIRILKG